MLKFPANLSPSSRYPAVYFLAPGRRHRPIGLRVSYARCRRMTTALSHQAHPPPESQYDESSNRCPAVVRSARAHIAHGGAIHQTPTGRNLAIFIGPCPSRTKTRYVHKNTSVKGFGTYGDIMIRDRKMYVAPTPFALTEGTTGLMTLILPENFGSDDRYQVVGNLTRVEADLLVTGYKFDLRTNELTAQRVPNPKAGTQHRFIAYRLKSQAGKPVSMKGGLVEPDERDLFDDADDE